MRHELASSAALNTETTFRIGPLPAAAANTTDSSLEAQLNRAAPLINGACGTETSVLETKVETRADTARFEADGGNGGADGASAGAGVGDDDAAAGGGPGSAASQVSVSKSESSWTSQLN